MKREILKRRALSHKAFRGCNGKSGYEGEVGTWTGLGKRGYTAKRMRRSGRKRDLEKERLRPELIILPHSAVMFLIIKDSLYWPVRSSVK